MQRPIKITATVERMVAEKFSMIYMELRVGEDEFKKRGPFPRWHLEDETRPTLALCGFPLHLRCKSVSPALALWGKPCDECRDIVAQWLTPKEPATAYRRMNALVLTDIPFRTTVTRTLAPEAFLVNYVEEKKIAEKTVARPRRTPAASKPAAKSAGTARKEVRGRRN